MFYKKQSAEPVLKLIFLSSFVEDKKVFLETKDEEMKKDKSCSGWTFVYTSYFWINSPSIFVKKHAFL